MFSYKLCKRVKNEENIYLKRAHKDFKFGKAGFAFSCPLKTKNLKLNHYL